MIFRFSNRRNINIIFSPNQHRLTLLLNHKKQNHINQFPPRWWKPRRRFPSLTATTLIFPSALSSLYIYLTMTVWTYSLANIIHKTQPSMNHNILKHWYTSNHQFRPKILCWHIAHYQLNHTHIKHTIIISHVQTFRHSIITRLGRSITWQLLCLYA